MFSSLVKRTHFCRFFFRFCLLVRVWCICLREQKRFQSQRKKFCLRIKDFRKRPQSWFGEQCFKYFARKVNRNFLSSNRWKPILQPLYFSTFNITSFLGFRPRNFPVPPFPLRLSNLELHRKISIFGGLPSEIEWGKWSGNGAEEWAKANIDAAMSVNCMRQLWRNIKHKRGKWSGGFCHSCSHWISFGGKERAVLPLVRNRKAIRPTKRPWCLCNNKTVCRFW